MKSSAKIFRNCSTIGYHILCFSLHNILFKIRKIFCHVYLRSNPFIIHKFVVNWTGTLVGKALDVVDERFLDHEVGPNFLLMVLWSCFLLLFSRGWGTNVVWTIWGSQQWVSFYLSIFLLSPSLGALVGKALNVVDELFLDPGVVTNFLLMVLW